MDITVNVEHGGAEIEALPVRELAEFVAAREGKPESTEASVSFVDDARMTELNEGYRKKSGPTDVLSFECDNLDDGFAQGFDADAPFELGDVVIAPDVARRQCDEFGTTLQEEIELLLVHGMLHLCGYDHIEDADAAVMEARERELLDAWRAR